MKNRFLKLSVLIPFIATLFTSCDMDDMINHRPVPGEEVEEEVIVYGKKGFGQTTKSYVWSNCVSLSQPYWHYSWGSDYPADIPDNVEFVPMIWGRNNVEEKIEKLKELADQGQIKYLLGFNEPDKEDQSHMTVDEAIALWPLLESVGVPLGSPAPAAMNSGWLQEFMSKADANGLRVDFICMHRYTDSIDPLKWMEAFQNASTSFGGRPVWITEMGLADWNATTPENNKRSEEQAQDLMKELLPMMDQADYIQRYAWFDGGRAKNQAALHISAIYETDSDILTDLGIIYAEHDANLETGSGNSTIPEAGDYGLVVDGGFEFRNEEGAWGGYDNGFTDATTAKAGIVSGRIQPDKNGDGGSMLQHIEAEANAIYQFSYSTKWASTPDGTIKVQVQDRSADKKPEGGWPQLYVEEISTSTDWADVTASFQTLENTSKITLVFYKGGTNDDTNAGLTELFIDEVSLFKTGEVTEPDPTPNPVPDSGLITDGGFEDLTAGTFPSSSESSWYGFDGSFMNDVSMAHTGSQYAILATDNNGDGAFINQVISVSANKVYALDMHSKWGEAPTTAGIIRVFDVTDGGKVELLNENFASATEWTNANFTFETAETTATIRITIVKPGGEKDNTVMIDDVILVETGDVEQPEPPVEKVEVVANGDFEGLATGALGTNTEPWKGYNSGTADIVDSEFTAPYEGTQCGRLKKDEASISQTITVEAGKTYVFSMYTKWEDGSAKDLKFTIKASNDNNFKTQEVIAGSDDWALTTFEYTVPEGHSSLTFNVYKGKDNNSGYFLIDNVSVIEK